METLTAQEAQEQLPQLIERSVNENRQYRITTPEGSMVLLPWETYENLLVTLELLSTPCLMDSLQQEQQGSSCCGSSHSCG